MARMLGMARSRDLPQIKKCIGVIGFRVARGSFK